MVAILSGTLLLDLFYAMSVSRLVLHGGETCIFGFCSCTWHLTHSSYQPPRSTLQLSGWPTPWKHAFIKTTFWKRLVAQHGNLAPMMALREARAQKGRVPEPEVGPPKKPMLSCCNKNRPLGTKMSVMSLPFHHDPGNQCFLPSTMCELSVRGRCAGLALDVFYLGSSWLSSWLLASKDIHF